MFSNFGRIKNVDDCFQTLEDHMLQLSTMKSTRFVEPFAKDVDFWERTLSYIMETIEVALTVQRQWLYLEVLYYLKLNLSMLNLIKNRTSSLVKIFENSFHAKPKRLIA